MTINVEATNAPCTVRTGFVFSTSGGYYYTSTPNPASEEFTVTANKIDGIPINKSASSSEEAFEVELYDNYGRKVKAQRSVQGKTIINVRDIPNGLYNVRMGEGKAAFSEHIQVAH